MDHLTDSPILAEKLKKYTAQSCEPMQSLCDRMNSVAGNLEGENCLKCKNRGFVSYVDGDYIKNLECECMARRRSMWRIKASGLGELLERCAFQNFRVEEPWQSGVLEKARAYAENPSGWFFIGGQPGSGKTHICTAIVGVMIQKGFFSRYMLWRDEVRFFNAHTVDEEAYNGRMDGYKNCAVLYIDDFFKTQQGKEPTKGEVNVAFELLNHRYNSKELFTVISCERSINEILEIDEAIGGRIYEQSREYAIILGCGGNKDFRLG